MPPRARLHRTARHTRVNRTKLVTEVAATHLTLRVTSVYSNDDSVSKAEGAWISGFLINGCGAVLGDYDDLIIAKHDTLPLHELQAAVCQGSGKAKDVDDDDDDAPVGLGVWWGAALPERWDGFLCIHSTRGVCLFMRTVRTNLNNSEAYAPWSY